MVKLNWDRILEVVKIGVLIVIAYSLFGMMNNPLPQLASYGINSGLRGIESELKGIESELKGINSELRGIKSELRKIATTISFIP